MLVICSCIFWQITVLQGWQMAMLLDKQMSIFPAWQMTTYPKWQICKYYPIVCMWLHTGHAKQPFALKGCKNPTRHIFPWLPGEAVDLHTGILTKTFVMSVLYLKSELNCGSGAINEEDASKAGGHGSQRARFPVSVGSLHASQSACTRSHGSRSVKVKQLSARHLLQPLKPRQLASREWSIEFWIY